MKMINMIVLLSHIVFLLSLPTGKKQSNATVTNGTKVKKQMGKFNFSLRLLSKSLNELDLSKPIEKSTFMNTIKYSSYHLTRAQLENIFTFIDHNDSNLIEAIEWDNFVRLYILPFEACNSGPKKYLLSVEEFDKCIKPEVKSKFIEFRRRDQSSYIRTMMEIISTRGEPTINFFDYLFIRRAMFGWAKCHSHNKYMALVQFQCAIKLAVPSDYIEKIEFKRIYDVGLRYQYNDNGLIELDFIAYLRVCYYLSVFNNLAHPNQELSIEKTNFIKSIREDRLPNNFEESEVEAMYQLTMTNLKNGTTLMNFESWAFFFHLHQLFNKYSIQRPHVLNQTELLTLLNDKLTPAKIVIAIDSSFTKFTEQQYQEASLILQKKRPNEAMFFFSFRQDASEATKSSTLNTTVNNSYYAINSSIPNRETFFTMFLENDKSHWSKDILFRAFQLANFFVEMGTSEKDSRVPVHAVPSLVLLSKLPKMYDKVNPPICTEQRRNLKTYKIFPKDVRIDLLTFLSIEVIPYKILKTTGQLEEEITETSLKVILKECGMGNIQDTVLDTAKKGFDKLKRRVFDTKNVIENSLKVHSVASELMRTKHAFASNRLKENKDAGRRYLDLQRRMMSSPFVK